MNSWIARFFLYWVINVALLWAAGELFRAVSFDTTQALLKAGIWLAVINSFLKPLFVILTLPITILTLGLFLIVINVLVLLCVAWLVAGMHLGGFWNTALVSLFISVGTMILSNLIKSASDTL